MLWGVCQTFRHFTSTAIFRHGTSINSLRRQPVRCASSAIAFQVRAVARHPSTTHANSCGSSQNPRENTITSGARYESTFKSRASLLPQPAPELVQMVETLYDRHTNEDATMEDLQDLIEPPELLDHLRDRSKATDLAVLAVNTGLPGRAYRVLTVAHLFGCRFKQNTYEKVVYQLTQIRRWAEVSPLVALGQRHTGRTSIRLLNWRTRALVEISQYRLLDQVLAEFEQANLQPNRRTYQTLVSGHLRNQDLERAKDCLEWMQEAGFPMDASTHSLLASSHRSLGPDPHVRDLALSSLSAMKEREGQLALNGLIQVAADSNDTESALRYFSHFDGPRNDNHRGCGTGANATSQDGAAGLFTKRSPQAGSALLPDVVTFTILVNHAAKLRDLHLAAKMFGLMSAYGIQPDSRFAAALIRLHCSTERFPVALKIAATLCRDKLAALSCLRDLGWEGKFSGGIPTTASHTSQSINALLKGTLHHRGLKGMQVFNRFMSALGKRHNVYTIETFISYLSRTRHARPRELTRIVRAFSAKLRPTLRHVQVIFASIVRRSLARNAAHGWHNLATSLQARHPATQDQRRQTLTHAPRGRHDDIGAMRLAQSSYQSVIRRLLSDRRGQSDKAIMHLRMRYHGVIRKDVRAAKETLDLMLKHGQRANEYHYAAMIESYCVAGDMQSAQLTLRDATRAGFARDPVMYTIIINTYAQMGRPAKASRTFERMLVHSVRPDVAVVDALAAAYYVNGRLRMARQVLIVHWSLFAPFPPELQNAPLQVLVANFRKLDIRNLLVGGRFQLKFKELEKKVKEMRQGVKRRRSLGWARLTGRLSQEGKFWQRG